MQFKTYPNSEATEDISKRLLKQHLNITSVTFS